MSQVAVPNPLQEQELINLLTSPDVADDLYKYVMITFPWGVAGTPLEEFAGPRKWQKRTLDLITAHIKKKPRSEVHGVDAGVTAHSPGLGPRTRQVGVGCLADSVDDVYPDRQYHYCHGEHRIATQDPDVGGTR